MSESTVFDNVDVLAEYLMFKIENITPIRLQKVLYFLFAFYGAAYGSVDDDLAAERKIEAVNTYPDYLFPDQFQAWKYGPVIQAVYNKFKADEYKPKNLDRDPRYMDIYKYIDEIITDTEELSDFKLVEMSHQDDAWRDKYDEKEEYHNLIMDSNQIVRDYKRYV